MIIDLQFRQWLPPIVRDQFDELVALVQAAYHKSHTVDDLHKSAQVIRVTVNHLQAVTAPDPTYRVPDGTVTSDIHNTSGGVMGTITWPVVCRLAGAFTNPATGMHRLITFYLDADANRWREVSRSAADSAA